MAWVQTADGEENDESDWDTVTETGTGTLDVAAAAKKNGSYGWSITVDGASNYAQGQLSDPDAETSFTAECWLDPNTLTMAADDQFQFMYETSHEIFVTLAYVSSAYKVNITTINDSAGYHSGTEQTITDAYHKIRVVWKASSGAGNDDGFMHLYIDDDYKTGITGIDNDIKTVGLVQFGACAGVDAGTSGTFYMDDCRWTDNIYLADITLGLVARFHDYNFTAPQHFTISSNAVQMTARYRDYSFTAPEKEGYG